MKKFEQTADLEINYFPLLEKLAKQIIEPVPENENFISNPDDVSEHDPTWHQYGIITHSIKALEAFRAEIPLFLNIWECNKWAQTKLDEYIDGKSKRELLEIAILLHDIGKFHRSFKYIYGIGNVPVYENHEEISEKLILDRSKIIWSTLSNEFNLTISQIVYVARCAGLHYELGKIRKKATKKTGKFSLSYINSPSCVKDLKEVQEQNMDFDFEIGLLFLSDNLAKTSIRISVENDNEIELKTSEIRNIINNSALHASLEYAVKQMPVSIKLVHKYCLLLNDNK